MRKAKFTIGLVMLSMIIFSDVKAQSSVSDKESARVFVQKFYDWYNKVYAKQRHIDAHLTVLKYRPQYLDKHLLDALVADDQGQAKRPREIIGLGFDPFTNTLDGRKGYQTGIVIQRGDKFLVDVHDIDRGRSKKMVLASKLILRAEVTKIGDHYVFSNFIYPKTDGHINGYINDGNNLWSILDSLHKDRIKQGIGKS